MDYRIIARGISFIVGMILFIWPNAESWGEGLLTVTSVTAGSSHTCVLLSDRTVRCWGKNYYGQIGNSKNIDSSVPVPVMGIHSATAITVGHRHTCAMLREGIAACWGDNSDGLVADNTLSYSSVPVTVSGLGSLVAIGAGS